MTGILNALIAGVSGAVKDAYFNLVSLLLPGNGTNGAQNNTFLDSSTNNFTITRNGDVTQGTFSPFSQTGWSNYFNGSAGLVYADSTNLEPGSGDFTWEAWVFHTAAIGSDSFYYHQPSSGIGISRNTSGKVQINQSGVATILTSTGSVNSNEWVHVAVVRSGSGSNNVKVYLNGTADATTATSTANFAGTGSIDVGKAASGSYMTGYFSNLRFCKAAVYTSNFTPSTSPLTTTSQGATNCNLLICQSNRFKDNSSNDFSATISGSPSVTPFSPFAPTSSYSAAAVGGSGYFDGSGDWLDVADNAAFTLGSGDFTIEFWFYPTLGSTSQYIFNQNSNVITNASFAFLFTNTNAINAGIFSGTTEYAITSSAVAINAWHHVAAVRSGSNYSLFIDGARVAAPTNVGTSSLNDATTTVRVGALADVSNSFPFKGYVNGARFVKGTAVYDPTQSTLTVPTAPLTAITNTSLLLNFTNAGVVDATAKNVLETEGNAQISTSVSKFGGGSIYLDGTGDYLIAPTQQALNLGSAPFTIEFWVNFSASVSGTNYALIGKAPNAFTPQASWSFLRHSSNKLRFAFSIDGGIANIGLIDTTNNFLPTTGQWYYIAVTRSGSTWAIYIDGVSQSLTTTVNGSATLSSAIYASTTPLTVGASSDGANPLSGYVDDLRITTGVARTITASPTAPFPVQ
jgi:hypothetical protein